MKHRESQIDPFNAGEPELPCDTPETQTLDDGHECELPEHSYQSPLKTPDAYDAPDTDEPKRPAQPAGSRAQRWRRQSAGAPTRPVSSGTDKPRRRGCGCLTIVIIVIALNILLPTLAFIPHCTGVMLEDGPAAPAEAELLEEGDPLFSLVAPHGAGRTGGGERNAVVGLSIHEGRKHQVKKMMQAVGHKVLRLHRDAFGPLRLTGLEEGSWRMLDSDETRALEALCERREHQ